MTPYFKLSFGLILLFFLISCGQKSRQQLETTRLSTPVKKDTTVITIKPPPIKPTSPIAIQIAGLSSTGCYGKCPVFEYKVFNDGRVTYFGRNYVEKMGVYEATLPPQLVSQITSYADLVGFFQMAELYPNKSKDIVELPSTISFVRKNGQKKTVTNRYGAPRALEDFETFFLNIMKSLSWRRIR